LRSDAIFRSVSQALHVAFVIDVLPVTQKSNTQVLIERLMEDAGVARSARDEGSVNFSGLSPMEVRGQCAMVRAAVRHHCTDVEAHALHAWFADQNASEKILGVHAMRDQARARCLFTVEAPAAQLLIAWHIHASGRLRDQVTERAIADENGLSQSTVHRNIVAVRKMASGFRRQGMDRLEALFARDGLVERPDTSMVSA
jgi:hypothetical protein